jgi:hypothetical protein
MSPYEALSETFVSPIRGLPALAGRRSFLPALAASTLAALFLAAAAVPRLDFERAAADAFDRAPGAPLATPHEREQALVTARKAGAVRAYGSALLGPALAALGAAAFLWLGLRVAGGRPAFPATFSVAAYALLPVALRELLSIPAALHQERIPVEDAGRLLPSSLGALLPVGARGPLPDLLHAMDLFSLGSLALCAVGMSAVARVSLRRAALAAALLWLGYVGVVKVALPSLARGGVP